MSTYPFSLHLQSGAFRWLSRVLLAAILVVLAVLPAPSGRPRGRRSASPEEGTRSTQAAWRFTTTTSGGLSATTSSGGKTRRWPASSWAIRERQQSLPNFGGAADKPVWLDDVNCVGDEAKLTECFYNNDIRNDDSRVDPPWGYENCESTENVGRGMHDPDRGQRHSVQQDRPHSAGAGRRVDLHGQSGPGADRGP